MATEYPNTYYKQLAQLIIENPTLFMRQGEVCFYEGKACAYEKTTKLLQGKPKTKTSLLITPFFAGVQRKKETEIKQVTDTEYYKGYLYITNMRIVFKCKIDSFDLIIPSITKISQYKDGIRVTVGINSYDVMTSDVKKIMQIIELMNKAQGA